MNHNIRIFDYLLLLLILTGGSLGFIFHKGNPVTQFLVVFLTVLLYIAWGIWHHKTEDRLSWGVVTEYLLVGALVLLLVYLALLF